MYYYHCYYIIKINFVDNYYYYYYCYYYTLIIIINFYCFVFCSFTFCNSFIKNKIDNNYYCV